MTTDTAVVDDAPVADSSVAPDTAPEPADTGTSPIDTGGTTMDTASPIDTAVADSAPVDTGVADTGTVVMDTAPTCSPSGEFGGKCKTNLDCAAIPGCGYVCCAYDPTGTFSLGCGRISGGSLCLP